MKEEVKIGIGGMYASNSPTVISTLLGSCVAVCLFDSQTLVGGMNHIFLPGKADPKDFRSPYRYGVNAMELLINRIMNLGGNRKMLVAKAFGGAHLLPSVAKEIAIGKMNVEFTLEFLRTEGIRLASGDLGGTYARKIFFHTDSGEVYLKKLKKTMLKKVSLREKDFFRQTEKDIRWQGEIYIFDADKDKETS